MVAYRFFVDDRETIAEIPKIFFFLHRGFSIKKDQRPCYHVSFPNVMTFIRWHKKNKGSDRW